MAKTIAKHHFLPKNPKRLAVVDQNGCSGCAGAPACITYCETVTVRKDVVDAIRAVPWPGSPFELAVVEYDKCIGCGICATACPWDAITMYSFDEALALEKDVTLVYHEDEEAEDEAAAPAAEQAESGA